MTAVELRAFDGFRGLQITEAAKPEPGPGEVLIQVQASGVNFAELELTKGRYSVGKTPPFVMGFEAAGIVVEVGSAVRSVRVGQRIVAIASSGGYAEFAVAAENSCIPIPDGISFADATTIPVQGLSAYALLRLAAKPQPHESILIQSAAGGVGLFLVQLAKIMGVRRVIALASSLEKLTLVRDLGADAAIDYSQEGWADRVRQALDGAKPDVILESASGEVGRASFELLAPFGRMVMFGARNIHDTFSPDQLRQLITANQTVIGFNIPTIPREMVAPLVPDLLNLIATRRIKLFASQTFPLRKVREAFQALESRTTIGKVVLTP